MYVEDCMPGLQVNVLAQTLQAPLLLTLDSESLPLPAKLMSSNEFVLTSSISILER